jgi:hypothetical protein
LWPRKSHPRRDSHPKRPETTTSCGLENPIHEGIPTQRAPEQQRAVAQKVPPTKGFPPKRKIRQVDFEKVNAEKVFVITSSQGKGKGLVRKIVEKSWLKQLKVAISTGANLPDKSSPQNSKTNFVDLRDDG